MAFASAKELGKKGSYKYIEIPCIDCGNLHWVALKRGTPRSQRCYSCSNKRNMLSKDTSMDNNSNWRGGKHKHTDGYVMQTIPKTHLCCSMRDTLGRVREHRLIMADELGRPLETCEVVHHKNGVKDDNRIGNLEIVTASEHMMIHIHPSLRKGVN